MILILDLGFFFEANFQREINNEYFSAYAGLDSIPDDQVEGLTLGIKAIKNINIKNLMIFYATGRALNEPGYKCLVKESKQFNILHPEPKLLRKITYLPEFGSPFVIADSARARRLGHAKSFLLNVAVQWTEFLEQSQIETETTDESDKSPQFKLIITGKKIMDERGYPGGLIIKVSRPGTDIKRRPINTPTTVKFARIIYEAIQAEDNFIPYGDIYLYADSTLPYKNGEFPVEGTESYDKAIKDEAKKTYNNLQRHLKQHLNILSNNESLSLLFREDIERKEFILMNFSCEIKLES